MTASFLGLGKAYLETLLKKRGQPPVLDALHDETGLEAIDAGFCSALRMRPKGLLGPEISNTKASEEPAEQKEEPLMRHELSTCQSLQGVVKEIDLSRMPLASQREAKTEADVLKRLKHANIVEYCESFLEGQMLCIVMEYADGGDLSHLIKERKAADDRLCEEEVLKIFRQCCLAIQHVHHQHILHRDLKSQNIFLTQGGVVKLGDFGIAKVLAHTAAEAITMIGTPLYLAPEVCHSQPYGMKADVWSLGVVLYELLALKPPFTGANLAALINNIVTATPAPVGAGYGQCVQELVSEMLQKEPDKRPGIQDVLASPCMSSALDPRESTAPDETFVPQHVLQQKQEVPDSLEHLLQKTRAENRKRPPLPDSAQIAHEFRRNREAAMAVKQRVEGRDTSWHQRSRSEDVEAAFSHSTHKGLKEADHLQALQEAAAQARRDRRDGQQRLRRELDMTPRAGNCDVTDHQPARLRASSADEAKHLFDLHEAAAQARRDRRQVQQRLKDLDRSEGVDWDIPPWTSLQQVGAAEPASPSRSKHEAEAQHLVALQAARVQARRDRKLIEAKRKAEEAVENEVVADVQPAQVCKPRTPEDRAAAEARHLQALKDAAAEARRERRMLQQKIQQELLGASGTTSRDDILSGPSVSCSPVPRNSGNRHRESSETSPQLCSVAGSASPSHCPGESAIDRTGSNSPDFLDNGQSGIIETVAFSDSLRERPRSMPTGSALDGFTSDVVKVSDA